MKFRLRQTSRWGENQPTVPERWQDRVTYDEIVHERSEEVMAKFPQLTKTYTTSAWYIDINDLEELLFFHDDVGDSLIIDGQSIEIYDDWRE